MDADRPTNPQRVKDAFDEASAMPTLARVAFLAQLRAESPALADEVESLLGYHARADAMARETGDPTVSLPSTLIGRMIGGCVIDRLVGYGGMSAVYSAMQEFPRRRVAVKIVRRERLSASARRRLRVEAEALARLAHPNIARVFAAGSQRLAASGNDRGEDHEESPFIVMELVEGAVPITKWANDRRLDARARIELVATIATAVEYAHRAGVIHRDLKPGNVIVGSDGTPKIIDFGIAAVRDSSVTAVTDGPMGTLAYMSPEQARGGAIDTRSDVWGLGALLYDLLSGQPPFDVGDSSVATHIDRLLHDTPRPVAEVARVAHGAAFVDAMPPATDAVLRKALANAPERRYQSAVEFADELRRLLAGEPLIARPDSEWDALVRLAQRHRAPLAAAAGIFAALTAGLVVSLTLLRSEAAANERAQWSAYVASISAASSMLERGDASAAHDMLESAPSEHRGWEWNALSRLSSQSRWAIPYGLRQQVYDIDWSVDGSRILAAASAYAVAIDRTSRRELWRVASPTNKPTWRLTAMADGHTIVRILTDDFMRVSPSGDVVARGVNETATDLATDAARTRLFANDVGGAQELDPLTFRKLRSIQADPPLTMSPRAIAAAPDASFFVLADADGVVTCIDGTTGARRWTWSTEKRNVPMWATAVSPDGARAVAAGRDGVVAFDTRDGALLWRHDDTTRDYRDVSFSADGGEAIASSFAESVDRLDARTGELRAALYGAFSQVWAAAASPDGRDIAAGTFNGRVEVFGGSDSSTLDEIVLDGSAVASVAVLDRVYASTADGAVFAIDARGSAARVPIARHANWICAVADGTLAVAHDAGVSWIDVASGGIVRDARTEAKAVRVGTIDRGATVTARLADGFAVAFDARDAHVLWRIGEFTPTGHVPCETAIAGRLYLPRGTGGRQASIDLSSMKEIGGILETEFPAMAELSPDRTLLAIAAIARANEVTVADARTLKVVHAFPNHRGAGRIVRWSPDGTRIASASNDGTVRLWHLAGRTEIMTVWRGQARDLAWDRDETLWIACDDGKLRAMRATPRQ